ncbi:hypothetical protein [Cupriavidus gilardii]|uniref:hypothetical protein n=1 Tax=Cupriavidus gilardii TaxID=82541 RepID=UPI00158094CC|nr:hypothetical protein [Cupriavidus gilardii]MCT9073413.1 hypothetical protein [Cupriavidus gilardii]QKS64215.1 hypothetical protein FOB47_20615 [Cupriavidus gilardii]
MIGVLSLCGASAVEVARVAAAWFALRFGRRLRAALSPAALSLAALSPAALSPA